MKKPYLLYVVLSVINASNSLAQLPDKNNQQFNIQPNQLVGNWYMGTMSGVDCNLQIRSDHALRIQFGGCFHHDPIIESGWKLQGNNVKLENPILNKSLGSFLRIVKYKGHLLLVPERPQQNGSQNKFSYSQCFWRNLMKNGLRLSKDAPA